MQILMKFTVDLKNRSYHFNDIRVLASESDGLQTLASGTRGASQNLPKT